MNRTGGCILLLALFSMIAPIHCHAQHMNEKDSPCPNAKTTLDMAQCFSEAKASSGNELSALYNRVLRRLDGDDADRLTRT